MRSLNSKTILRSWDHCHQRSAAARVCQGVLANELNVERSRNLQSFTQLLRNTLANQVGFTMAWNSPAQVGRWDMLRSKFGRSWPFLMYFPLGGQIPPVDHPGSESCHFPQCLPTRSVASLFGMVVMWQKGPVWYYLEWQRGECIGHSDVSEFGKLRTTLEELNLLENEYRIPSTGVTPARSGCRLPLSVAYVNFRGTPSDQSQYHHCIIEQRVKPVYWYIYIDLFINNNVPWLSIPQDISRDLLITMSPLHQILIDSFLFTERLLTLRCVSTNSRCAGRRRVASPLCTPATAGGALHTTTINIKLLAENYQTNVAVPLASTFWSISISYLLAVIVILLLL